VNLPYLPAYAHGGPFPAGQPHLIVIHSTEGPMSRGNARALAGPAWFGGPKAGTSAHSIFDPAEGVEMVHQGLIAWHVGPGGNGISVGAEHCGRVRLTREQWLSPDARSMLGLSARWHAQLAGRLNIPPRWLSLTQLRGGASGFCTHNDIRLVFGGTTHSDPGPNFPYAWYMSQLQAFYAGTVPPPDPTPGDDDMTDEQARQLKAVYDQITAAVIPGQLTFAASFKVVQNTLARLFTMVQTDDGALAASLTDFRQAALAAVAALPTDHLSDAELAELAERIGVQLADSGVPVDPAALLDALHARLAA
jgi:hypothetical protein